MTPTTDERLKRLGVQIPSILLPHPDTVDLFKWAVIACDQHTSEPDYWEEVASLVGESPSTLHLIFPEVYLNDLRRDERISSIHTAMREYLERDILVEQPPAMILSVRGTPHVSERRGLMLALDLDAYDFTPGSGSLIRATEQTIVERIPPRMEVRRDAPIEVPHILVLVNDPQDDLIGSLDLATLEPLYSTQLMLGGGRVSGYRLGSEAHLHVAEKLEQILDENSATQPFLFAVGDGNHSLATAKAVWEEIKEDHSENHPARYALVEVVNIYDPGLRFEPIHRLISFPDAADTDPVAWIHDFAQRLGSRAESRSTTDVRRAIDHEPDTVGYVTGNESGVIHIGSRKELPVAKVQSVLDEMHGFDIDFIHGWDTSVQLGSRSQSAAVLLPEFDPHLLYPTVSKRGILPRKAFSLGDAEEKRYYLEARRVL